MKRYENIDDALCREMDKLDKKYANDTEMSMQDLEMIRLIFSSMVKADTHYAMQEEKELDEDDMSRSGRSSYGRGGDRSYRRGRDSMGRYVSRDMEGYSGHYPEWMPPYYGGRY